MMNVEEIKKIKTLCGGIFHCRVTYRQPEFSDWEWEQLIDCLQIKSNTIYWLEPIPNGFKVITKTMSFKYLHDDFSWQKRVIEFKY
jgi:hypothetical protein